jgi:hypothetical protein
MQFDHFAIAGETLEAAVAHVQEALGVALLPGGKHVHFGTHNQLLGLADGLYLEAIAIDPNAAPLAYPRWFDLDRFSGSPRISNWICRSTDILGELAQLPEGAGHPVALKRGDLAWRMAVPSDGILPCDGCFPALIQWDVEKIPGDTLPVSGCRLEKLEVAHPEAKWLQNVLDLSDPRVVFTEGPRKIRATIQTPHGIRELS